MTFLHIHGKKAALQGASCRMVKVGDEIAELL